MKSVVADTHALIWLVHEPVRLSAPAAQAFAAVTAAGNPIIVASISLVELRYLVEKGKIDQGVLDRIDAEM